MRRMVDYSFLVELSKNDKETKRFTLANSGLKDMIIKSGEVITDINVMNRDNVYFRFSVESEEKGERIFLRGHTTLDVINFCTDSVVVSEQ